jgi:hypothetical protein
VNASAATVVLPLSAPQIGVVIGAPIRRKR